MIKKTTITTLTILLTMLNFSVIANTDHAFKPSKKRLSNAGIQFIPDAAFGDFQAQGIYKKRNKTAQITDNDTIYSFNIIVENPNPWLKTNKFNLVKIGYFSDKTNRFGMPATNYLFGAATDELTRNVVEISKTTQNLLPNELSTDEDQATYSPVTFKPSKQFIGEKLIGSYLSNSHIATIQDPSRINDQVYIFENVVEGLPISMTSDLVRPIYQPILIGSYSSTPQCSAGIPKICSNAIKITELYGNLKTQQ